MIGKRRFIVIVLALVLLAGVELVNKGWSATGQLALLGIVGTYFGFDMGSKIAKSKNGG